MPSTTIASIRKMLEGASLEEIDAIERSLVGDSRKGVKKAIEAARSRTKREQEEVERLERLYGLQNQLAEDRGASVIVGLDEVGRGPLAGPLCVGAVILDSEKRIPGLNDSKLVSEAKRKEIAMQIEDCAIATSIVFISPQHIDEKGMTACLRAAFREAIREIESKGHQVDLVLLDGNPLHIDERELNVVKGDRLCASISAASIIAKVSRDEVMVKLDEEFPEYGFASNKGYGSAAHMEAIREFGLTPHHRKSFCTGLMQESLF